MSRWGRRFLAAALVIGPAILIVTVFVMLPKAETPRDEALPAGNLTVVATGDVRPGGPDHPASGNVTIFWNGTGYVLRFEGYDARSGPNVWFYLTPDEDPDSEAAVEEAGLRVRVPGPGQATHRGAFNVPVPDAYTPDAFRALVAWDDTFDRRHAWAPLVGASSQDP